MRLVMRRLRTHFGVSPDTGRTSRSCTLARKDAFGLYIRGTARCCKWRKLTQTDFPRATLPKDARSDIESPCSP
jgi:hypothetical protein